MSLSEKLTGVMRGEVDDSDETLRAVSRDASLFYMKPQVVVRPRDADDVARAVAFVNAERRLGDTRVSLTARSAGTDMSGGPLSDSIVLDMTAYLNHFLGLSCRTVSGSEECVARVGPGMYFRDFDRETKKANLELPSYTASREINTVGGMAANNSGGEKNLKYGKTARYVEELEVVLADGERHRLRKLRGSALEEKLAEETFEGGIYRAVAALVRDYQHVIAAGRPHVEKNSAGYALWDIGDGVESLDLARLMVGAQGTLGIITEITFSLVRPKPYAAMVVLFLNTISELGVLVPEVLMHQPDSFESYDDHTFKLAIRYFPEFAAQMSAGGGLLGLLALGISFMPEMFMLATGGVPKLVLLAEFRADSQGEACAKADALAAEIHVHNPHIHARVARSEAAARKYWVVRRESFNLLRKKVRGKRTAPFIDDFVVPPEVLPAFLPKLETLLAEYHLVYTVAGHVGDGNFHIIPLVDPRASDLPKLIDELSHKVYDLVLAYHGSITGEHNDGLVRTPYVEKMFGPEMHALFVKTKNIFDPQNIFNPGKKVGMTFAEALVHLDVPPHP